MLQAPSNVTTLCRKFAWDAIIRASARGDGVRNKAHFLFFFLAFFGVLVLAREVSLSPCSLVLFFVSENFERVLLKRAHTH